MRLLSILNLISILFLKYYEGLNNLGVSIQVGEGDGIYRAIHTERETL